MLKRIGAEEGGEFKAVASGTLPCGKPVIVNADGTVSVVSQTSVTEGVGSPVVFESATTTNSSAVYDSYAQKVVIAYTDGGNSSYGTAIVGTVSGTSISFGSPTVFESASSSNISATYDSNAQKVVIAYSDVGGSEYGTAIVGTVSGTSISFGSAAVFESASSEVISAAYDANAQKVVIAYRDFANSSKGTAVVGTVSGTSISFGSPVIFEQGGISYSSAVYDSNAQKVVITYRDNGNSYYGTAIVGTVSGTSISFGSAVVFESANSEYIAAVYDSNAQKVVIAYTDAGNSNYGTAIVGTVSGTSISFGSAVLFESADSRFISITYDVNVQKVVIAYRDTGNSNYGTVIVGTVSGTSISFGSASIFESANSNNISATYDANAQKVVIAYTDSGNNDYGTSIVFQNASTTNNLTSENYIGMSRGVAFQTGSADSVGSETEFVSNMGNEISAGVYDPDSSKVVLAYSDSDNSTRGTAIVGTVSGTSISFGSPAVYNSGTTNHIGITYDTTNNKVVIVYDDTGNSGYGTAVVGTVSGTSISFGSEVVYNTASSHNNNATFDTNTGKVVIAFSDDTNNDVISRVGTVSGTSISFGTAVQVADNGGYVKIVFDSNSNKVVVVFRDSANSNYGTARVGTVSGTDISFGSAVVFASSSTEDIHCAFDSTNNKVVISYKDGGDSDKGKCIVGTVSGTGISFGSAVTFHNASTGTNDVVYNSNSGKVFLFYKGSGVGKVVSGTVSGTTVGSLSSEFTYHNASTGVPFMIYDVASTNIVVAYRDSADSGKGKAVVFKPDNIVTTRGQVTNGQAASMDIIGSVSDNQISLTAGQQYFVQNDGTISTTADSPSVLAGTAISATELVVKT